MDWMMKWKTELNGNMSLIKDGKVIAIARTDGLGIIQKANGGNASQTCANLEAAMFWCWMNVD